MIKFLPLLLKKRTENLKFCIDNKIIYFFPPTFFWGGGCYNSRRNGPIRVNPIPLSAVLRQAITKMFWTTYRIIVPLYFLGMNQADFWRFFFLVEFITGYYLAFNFQVRLFPLSNLYKRFKEHFLKSCFRSVMYLRLLTFLMENQKNQRLKTRGQLLKLKHQ